MLGSGSAKLFFKEEVNDYGGLTTYRYWGTNHTFANGTTVPGNECYCVGKTCAPMGLLNAESCRMGAPALLERVPDVYLPMLWFEVQGGMTPSIASQMKMLVYFMNSSVPSVVVWSVIICLAVLAMVVVLLVAWRRNSSYDLVT
ncbi:Scavenger receptor class B member 1 [Portunus trituberculatus]|uniref:Scavenger receptor class B member 1 n=1 Tax=Portunus trituberculatus TaxID=210409 RepID=A0A5B7CNB3_PORTR|nr:Scavenger receptor class B member 1 [Portunus trituberculatus]